MTISRASAHALDREDPVSFARSRFTLPEGVVYLDGNSLGALSEGVRARLDTVVDKEWGELLIRAWNDADWWGAPPRIGDRVGRLLGAAPGQTMVGESTSVQIFNALVAAARLRPQRKILVTDPDHFPTNRYLAASAARLLDLELVQVPPAGLAEVLRRRGDEVAVVAYGAVDYRTGELWDIRGVTTAAHAAGAVVVWDLCHAAGSLPLHLDRDAVDVAVGCTYKFLCGGPGAPAFIYVADRHQSDFDLPLTGWHGHAQPFNMAPDFEPSSDIFRTRIGTPHVLSLMALDAALNVFDGVEMDALRQKNLSLGDFFLSCVDSRLTGLTFEVVTPREQERRGSQVALRHPEAHAVMAALIERGVIGDVRQPDLLRFGFNGLYVSHADIYDAVTVLKDVVTSGAHRDPRFAVRKPVS